MSINHLAAPLWPDLCYILTSYMVSKQNHITQHAAENELLSACSGFQFMGLSRHFHPFQEKNATCKTNPWDEDQGGQKDIQPEYDHPLPG